MPLSGTGSDPDATDATDATDTLSYRWRQTDGQSQHRVPLATSNTATATFPPPPGCWRTPSWALS